MKTPLFSSKKEKTDFAISILVLLFFAWLLCYYTCDKEVIEPMDIKSKVAAVIPATVGQKDTDGDGVFDHEDRCPQEFGYIMYQGCKEALEGEENEAASLAKKDTTDNPDWDNDGILNEDDDCPRVSGDIENKGCPADADKDGVYDKDDSCPTIAGLAENKGCPDDRDGDGIADNDDRCPTEAGVKENGGCPNDADKDGIYDRLDKCPNIAGTAQNSGCPADTDKDGVYDKDDKCPDVAGVKERNGCPEVKLEEKEKKILEEALTSVEFETNSAYVKNTSKKILKDIVKIMKKYPDYKLSVYGHTDNVGKSEDNLKLSSARANTCMKYIIRKGVDADRIDAKGFGDSKPLESNDTWEGRKKNRRVEFDLHY